MKKQNKILIGTVGALLLAASLTYASAGTIADVLVKLGLVQKQLDAIQSKVSAAPKLGGITAFSECYTAASSTFAVPSVVRTVGATTTSATCDTQGRSRKLSLLAQVGSVTTAGSYLTYNIQFSHDNSTWFTESSAQQPLNNIAAYLHVASTTHRITAANAGTTTVAIELDNPLARYIRIQFSASEAQMNFAGVIEKQEDQN